MTEAMEVASPPDGYTVTKIEGVGECVVDETKDQVAEAEGRDV